MEMTSEKLLAKTQLAANKEIDSLVNLYRITKNYAIGIDISLDQSRFNEIINDLRHEGKKIC